MATATAEPDTTTAQADSAFSSFGEALDKALGDTYIPEQPEAAPVSTPETPSAAPSDTPSVEDSTGDVLLKRILGTEDSPKEDAATAEEQVEVDKALENATPAAKARWGELKKKAASFEKRVQELEAKLKEAPAVKADPEAERLRVENQEMARELQVARVEATPEFKAAVVAPIKAISDSVSALATKYEVSPQEIMAAFAETDTAKSSDKLSELATSFNERDRVRLYEMADRYGELQTRRETIIANAGSALERIEKQRADQEAAVQQEVSKTWKSAVDKSWDSLQQTVGILKPIEGNEVWNKHVEQIEAAARSIDPLKLSIADQARLAHQGLIFPIMFNFLKQQAGEVMRLKTENGKLKKATPGAGSGSGAVTSNGVSEDADFLTAFEAGASRA